MSTYVYGFTSASHPLSLDGLVGVGTGAPSPRLIRHDGLVAVVGDAPANLRAKRRDLEAHERVLERLRTTGTVLPMRFGTVAPDDAHVRAELTAGRQRYLDLLAHLENRVELNVKGSHVEDALLADLLREDGDLRSRNAALRSTGGGRHADRVAFGESVARAVRRRRERDAERTLARLTAHASTVRLAPPVEGCFLNASFLVEADARGAFEDAVARLRDELHGYADLRVFGPLPPYSFVAVPSAAAA